MKKLFKVVTTLLLFFIMTGFTNQEVDNEIVIDSNNSIEKALENAFDGPLQDGDEQITKDAIEVGLYYAEKNAELASTSSKISPFNSGYEEWEITNMETRVPYGAIKGDYGRKIAAGTSQTQGINFSISISGSVKGVTIDAAANWSTSVTRSGPSGTELVAPGVYATHRYFSAIGSGSVVRYTYRVTDQRTGAYLRTERRTYVANRSITSYANLGNYNAANGYVRIRSAGSSATKYLMESSWISYVNGTSAYSYVYF